MRHGVYFDRGARVFPFAFVLFAPSLFDLLYFLSFIYFRPENSTMIREHEGKWRFRIFSKRRREVGGGKKKI